MADKLIVPALQEISLQIKAFRLKLQDIINYGRASEDDKAFLKNALKVLVDEVDKHKQTLNEYKSIYKTALVSEDEPEFKDEMTARIKNIDEVLKLAANKLHYQRIIDGGKMDEYIALKNELKELETSLNTFIQAQNAVAAAPKKQINAFGKNWFRFISFFVGKSYEERIEDKSKEIVVNANAMSGYASALLELTRKESQKLDGNEPEPEAVLQAARPAVIEKQLSTFKTTLDTVTARVDKVVDENAAPNNARPYPQ